MKDIEELMLDNKTDELRLDNQIKVGCIKQSQEKEKLHILKLTDCQRNKVIELLKEDFEYCDGMADIFDKDIDYKIERELDRTTLEQLGVKL